MDWWKERFRLLNECYEHRQEKEEWCTWIPICTKSYNERKHHTTGVTPFSLMFNREARTKLDRHKGFAITNFDDEENRVRLWQTKHVIKTEWSRIMINMPHLHRWLLAIEFYNMCSNRGGGKSKKLNRRWRGPFRVVAVNRPVLTVCDAAGTEKLLHLNHVKKTICDEELATFKWPTSNCVGRCGGNISRSSVISVTTSINKLYL